VPDHGDLVDNFFPSSLHNSAFFLRFFRRPR
jgi:hypothetical protein